VGDKNKPRARTESSGFDKRTKMQVSVEEVQAMQHGYETRIENQKASINRLVALLEKRNDQLREYMRDETNDAALIAESELAPIIREARAVEEAQEVITPAEAMKLLKMVTERYDLFNEDDTPFTIIAGYLKWCADEFEQYKITIRSLRAELKKGRDKGTVQNIPTGLPVTPPVDSDDTPPWEKRGHVAPATVDHNTPLSAPGDPAMGVSETLDWGWASQLPPGESKPGRF